MSIYVGTNEIKNVYVGTTPVKEIFVGTTKVRPSGWKPGANTVAYYPLTSDFNDASGNSRNLTNSGGTITTLNGVTCAYYNGSSYSSYNNYSWTGTKRTISGRVRKVSTGIPLEVSKYRTSDTLAGSLEISFYSSYLLIADSAGNETFAEPCSAGVWYHVVCVQEGNTVKGYLNGVYKGGETNRPIITPTGWCLGAKHNSFQGTKYNGYISNIILENKARTAQEVSDYYNSTKSNYGL